MFFGHYMGSLQKKSYKHVVLGVGATTECFGAAGLAHSASPNGQYGEEILALMSAITMMNPNYIVM